MSKRLEVPHLESEGYAQWKMEMKLWKNVCGIKKEQQGAHVFLSLSRENRSMLRNMKTETIEEVDGVENIIAELDKIFLADVGVRKFYKFTEILNMKRSENENIQNFVVRFDNNYREFEDLCKVTDDTTKAFILLRATRLKEEDVKSILTTLDDVSYEEVRRILKRRFCLESGEVVSELVSRDQEKDVLVGEEENWTRQTGCKKKIREEDVWYGNQGYQGNQRYVRNRYRGGNDSNRGGRGGCSICRTGDHMTRDCKKAYWNKKVNEGKSTEYTGFVEDVLLCGENVVDRTKGMAIVDTGCTSTVCGRRWINDYKEKGGEMEEVEGDETTYRFGDGKKMTSSQKVMIKLRVGLKNRRLQVNIVEGDVTLLLSINSLKRMAAVIDCNGKCIISQDERIELIEMEGGHLCMPLIR